jgi:hypothetical protein
MLLVAANGGRHRTPAGRQEHRQFAKGLAVGAEVHAGGVDEVFINRQSGVRSMFGLADFGGKRQAPLAFGATVG